jgi:transposase-like protein
MESIVTVFDFERHFSSEEDCYNHLIALRWPQGFVCPRCGSVEYYYITTQKRYECKHCHRQTSVTAGTVFHKLRQPLRKLFWAVYLTGTDKQGISATELQRKLGIKSYRTVWNLMHRIRAAMASSGAFPLTKAVEVDETYIGGHQPGKRGRGAQEKTVVAIAVETAGEKEHTMGRAYLETIPQVTQKELKRFLHAHVMKGVPVKTDGLHVYSFVEHEYHHQRVVLSRDGNTAELLPKVHIVISNLKMWLRGTYHALPQKYLQNYLNEFVFRFNRRGRLSAIFDSLLFRCVTHQPVTVLS